MNRFEFDLICHLTDQRSLNNTDLPDGENEVSFRFVKVHKFLYYIENVNLNT